MKFLLKVIWIGCVTLIIMTALILVKDWQKAANSADYLKNLEQHKDSDAPCSESASPASEESTFISPYEAIFTQNQDMVGWIEIPDTILSYPVMHTPDSPNYYLRRDFQKNDSELGVPYLSENCHLDYSDNLLIYGHNFDKGKMFGLLMNYKSYDYYTAHPTIVLDTRTETRTYRIFAVCKLAAVSAQVDVFPYYTFTNAQNQEEYEAYVQNLKKYALYDTPYVPQEKQQIITLSTCEYSQPYGRLIVAGYLENTVS